jgi:hypothetical protein
VINASIWKLHRLPLRFASHLSQLPFQLRGPLFRVRQPPLQLHQLPLQLHQLPLQLHQLPLQLRNARVPFATPRTAVNDPDRSSSMMAEFFQRNLPQIAKTIPAAW